MLGTQQRRGVSACSLERTPSIDPHMLALAFISRPQQLFPIACPSLPASLSDCAGRISAGSCFPSLHLCLPGTCLTKLSLVFRSWTQWPDLYGPLWKLSSRFVSLKVSFLCYPEHFCPLISLNASYLTQSSYPVLCGILLILNDIKHINWKLGTVVKGSNPITLEAMTGQSWDLGKTLSLKTKQKPEIWV